MARTFDARQSGFAEQFDAFLAEPRGAEEDVAETVRDVIADVRGNGGEAVARYTAKFDELVLDPTMSICIAWRMPVRMISRPRWISRRIGLPRTM